jgi:hypothetical protein
MKLTHTLAVIALSASLGACIVAPPRPYYASAPAPVAAPVYYEPAPAVQVLPYVGLGWWMGRYWGGGHHGHHGHNGGYRR